MAAPGTDSDKKDGLTRAEMADDRDDRADAREAALDEREAHLNEAEAALADRKEAARKILLHADGRDDAADARDKAADGREAAASLVAFLDDRPDTRDPGVRRAAALDRRHSKTDRSSAATDRVELSGDVEADREASDDADD